MADDSNNVTIVLNLDNGSFTQKTKESESAFESFTKTINNSFDQSLGGAISLNQALELGKKIMEGFEASIRAMNFSESFKNQETALRSLTNQIGVNSDDVINSIKKATNGTVTTLEATKSAFKLLNAGVKADAIPAIAEYAEWLEKSSGGSKRFEDTIGTISRALETGSSRGLKEYGIKVGAVGDRMEILNSILDQAHQKMENTNAVFDSTAKKIETRWTEFGESIKKSWGNVVENIGIQLFGDDIDKTSKNIKGLEYNMKLLEQGAASGATQWSVWNKELGSQQDLPIAQARIELEKQLAAAKGVVLDIQQKEKKDAEETNSKLTQKTTIVQQLTQAQQQQVTIEAKSAAAAAQVASEEATMGSANLRSYQELQAAKRQEIDRTFQIERQRILDTPQSYASAKAQIVKLEEEQVKEIKALRVDDTSFMEAQQEAETKFIMNNMMQVENAKARLIQIDEAKENQRHQREMEKLRSAGLSKGQFDRQMEQQETQHQQRLSAIKQQYDKVNMKNFQVGLNTSLKTMKTQFASFSNFVTTATTKTHSIMSKGFVDLAKGHGDAMQQMLGQFLEMIGTQMIEAGVFHLLAGIASFDPVEAGAGVALIAAGGAIVGASAGISGSASSGGSSDSGGGASTGVSAGPGDTSSPGPATADQTQGKKASIIIQGDFLNSRETGNHLADILRSNSDITDYTITAQGKQYA